MIVLEKLKEFVVEYKERDEKPIVLVDSKLGEHIRRVKKLKTNRRYVGKIGGSRIYVYEPLDNSDEVALLLREKEWELMLKAKPPKNVIVRKLK